MIKNMVLRLLTFGQLFVRYLGNSSFRNSKCILDKKLLRKKLKLRVQVLEKKSTHKKRHSQLP